MSGTIMRGIRQLLELTKTPALMELKFQWGEETTNKIGKTEIMPVVSAKQKNRDWEGEPVILDRTAKGGPTEKVGF